RGFGGAYSTECALRAVEEISSRLLKKVIRLQLLRAHAVRLEGAVRYAEALEALKKVLQEARRLRIPSIEIVAAAHLGNILRRMGRLRAAYRSFSEALKRAQQTGKTLADS